MRTQMQTQFLDTLAKSISLLFGFPLLFVIMYLILNLAMVPPGKLLMVTLVLFFLNLVIPAISMILLAKHKLITDFDLTNRRERIVPMLILLICIFSSLIYLLSEGFYALFVLMSMISILLVINFLITLFWKISLHMTANSIAFVLMYKEFGKEILPLLIIFPFVYWSRIYLKKHTHAQLFAGLVINGVLLSIMLKVLY